MHARSHDDAADRPPTAVRDDHRHFLPGMGRHGLLPLYDPFSWLLGIPRDHAALLDQAHLGPGDRVLEIGCGTGNLALRTKRRHPSVEVVGLDPDGAALDRAARKARRAGLDVRWDRGFADALPYPDASFDLVLSAMMLHHVEAADRPTALREVARVLAPGGTVLVLDIGGHDHGGEGLMGRFMRHAPRLADNLDGTVPDALRRAGFVAAAETGHRTSRVMGQLTTWRATAPSAS
jgi:ubiquinone/menaquinone biosynthesis C-methylase UbiE